MNTNELLNPERGSNESFEDYRLRRKNAHHFVKTHARGTVVWKWKKGTYNLGLNKDKRERAARMARYVG